MENTSDGSQEKYSLKAVSFCALFVISELINKRVYLGVISCGTAGIYYKHDVTKMHRKKNTHTFPHSRTSLGRMIHKG
jgi:hypothetical protein